MISIKCQRELLSSFKIALLQLKWKEIGINSLKKSADEGTTKTNLGPSYKLHGNLSFKYAICSTWNNVTLNIHYIFECSTLKKHVFHFGNRENDPNVDNQTEEAE